MTLFKYRIPIVVGSISGLCLMFIYKQIIKRRYGNKKNKRVAVIELGGTTCSAAIANIVYDSKTKKPEITILEKIKNETTNPEPTLDLLLDFLKEKEFDELKIGSFGPLQLHKSKSGYGTITTSPKPLWIGFNLLNYVKETLKISGLKITLETDVNTCAIGEFTIGNHPVKNSLAYITVGTGVGIGFIVNGKPVHGLIHPEGGHVKIKKHPSDLNFKGVCHYHTDCAESLVCNNAIALRKGCSKSDLIGLLDSDPIWNIIAYYLAQICLSVAYAVSPDVIVIGGGVLNRTILYELLYKEYIILDQGLTLKDGGENLNEFIRPPGNSYHDVGIKAACCL